VGIEQKLYTHLIVGRLTAGAYYEIYFIIEDSLRNGKNNLKEEK
jgi:hypothetical protein